MLVCILIESIFFACLHSKWGDDARKSSCFAWTFSGSFCVYNSDGVILVRLYDRAKFFP